MKKLDVDLSTLLPRIFTRSRVIFLVGLSGIINEVFVRTGSERPSVLAALMGMIGLPAFVKLDKKEELPPKKEEEDPSPKGKEE